MTKKASVIFSREEQIKFVQVINSIKSNALVAQADALVNWAGIAYKIPCTEIEESKSIEHLSYNGVYFLFGTSEAGNDVVYIGQARTRTPIVSKVFDGIAG